MTPIACPKCKGTRFLPVKPVWEYRRNWRGVVERYRIADISGCEGCRVVWEIARNGAMSMHEDAPKRAAEAPQRNGEERVVREPLPERVERPYV